MTLHATAPSRSQLATAIALTLSLSLGTLAQAAPRAEPPMPISKAKAPVTLNFVNAEVEMVSRAMAAALDREIVVDPRVKGTVTITSERALPPQEAWRSYLAALRGLGFTVVETAGMLKVVPEAEAKLQTGTVQVGAPTARGDQVLTQIFRLNHENPNNLVAVLRPLISANNTINANPGNNTLVITDYADNLQRLGKIIAALDQPAASEVEVVSLQHALASDLAPLVQKLTDGSGAAAVPGAPAVAGGNTSILVEPRSNSLIIRAANPARMSTAKSLIEKLDKPSADGGPAGSIHVVYLKNSDAVKLAEVLRAVLASASSTGGASASAGGGVSSFGAAASGMAGNTTGNSNSATGAGSAAATTPVAQSARPSTGGQIQADPSTNSLIISAPEPVYRQLRQVIDQLDTRRAQIYVESLIVKVNVEKLAQFGIQWQNLFGNKGDSSLVGAGTNSSVGGNNILGLTAGTVQGVTGAAGLVNSILGGLNIGVAKKIGSVYTLGAVAHFLETNGGANVLSTPTLIALDNEEAKIVVGSNVPFVTGTFTNTGTGTGATNPFQTIERKDVGLTLRIRSQVGEGGAVRMNIYQENSSVQPGSETRAQGPTTDKSAIETSVVVDDGSMIVLGGLLKDEYGDAEDRVPGLASLPVLGNLFRSEKRTRVKSNLMIFLRPVVIRDQNTSDKLMLDRYESIRSSQQQVQPEPTLLLPVDAPKLPEQPPASPLQPSPAR
ncbi:MAG: type II secretion system secretin GspD [Vitreoscilla sp.]|nr:type II secretion system secretin GspD [Vitreoscilla sp.]